jgi:putative FmdB family regulatory protein
MPIFEYECTSCGRREELLLHHSESEVPLPCNECNGKMYKVPVPIARTSKAWEVK